MDPLEFLVRHAPFDALSAAGRERIAAALEITWARAGDAILRSGEANRFLYAVRKGHVRLELDGQQVAELGPGEVFGVTVLAAGDESPRLDVTAGSDCLLYRLGRDTVRGLCDAEPAFARFFLDRLAERLRRLTESQAMSVTSDLGRRVGDLVRRRPVTLSLPPVPVPADAAAAPVAGPVTVEEAARTMDAARVSSVLLVEDGEEHPVGILTDRDLRRVLARGLGGDAPVREVMTAPVDWLDAATPGSEALLHMLRSGRRHLVLEDGGRLLGVVTQSDLLRNHLQSPAALLETIAAAAAASDLAGYADRVATMVETLHRSGVEATDVGRLVAALNDALSARLLALAEAELLGQAGPPPCDYAWIVFGSEGRQEQSFLTDQDNALIYADDSAAAGAYFERLARCGVDSLLAVGFPPCQGGFMATNWCLPRDEWARRFSSWIEEPDPENLMRVANFFDWRRVAGGLDLEPLEDIVRRSAERKLFIAQLARASMKKRPPLGLLHRIVEDEGGVDLKSGALMPIAGLARLFALEAGTRGGSTLRRLRRAASAGVVSEDGAEVLAEAFRFTFGLRLESQLADREAGRPITHYVDLDRLSAGERRHLREAFLAVDRMQKATEMRLATGQLG
jgi:CBS domain-containing protein